MTVPPYDPPARLPADVSPDAAAHDVTDLLLAWAAGDRAALDALMPVVYDELYRRAERFMRREGPRHTLQATALVGEAYLRLVKQNRARWQNRMQFYGVAAQCMRRVLLDHARARRARTPGGGLITLMPNDTEPGRPDRPAVDAVDVIALDAALTELGALDPALVRLVELRYYAGLSINETAEILGVAPATVKRHWDIARGFLHRRLADP
jgi:RNA polymerase sigma factor (TIGR02999 family)